MTDSRSIASSIATFLCCVGLAACITNPPPAAAPPPEAKYPPDFKYSFATSPQKIDVAVGVVAPQFSGDGTDWWKTRKHDECTGAMVRGFRDNFESLFLAKGFNTAGPFDSVDDMAYSDKQTSIVVVYPDFDVQIGMDAHGGVSAAAAPAAQAKPANPLSFLNLGSDSNKSPPASGCTAKISVSGSVKLTVKEPISGQTLWNKVVDVSQPDQKLALHDGDCTLDDSGMLQGAKQAWAQTHLDVFREVMKEVEKNVSADQFLSFKAQSQKIRSSVTYTGH